MSQTGSFYKITSVELDNIRTNQNYDFGKLTDFVDVSYVASDLFSLFSSYSGLNRKEIGQILEGKSLPIGDGYLGYWKHKDVEMAIQKVLDKISENDIIEFLNKAEDDNSSLSYHYGRNVPARIFLIELFTKIKQFFEEAKEEQKCLLMHIG